MLAERATPTPSARTRDSTVARPKRSAGITLVKGDLRGIVRARLLSRATMRNIRQNLFLAFVYNTLGIPIAAGVLYPFLGILLSPMIASAAMSLSSVSVIGNALRRRRARLDADRSGVSAEAAVPPMRPSPAAGRLPCSAARWPR